MITLEQVQELARLQVQEFPVTTLFLSIDSGADKRKAEILLKDLIKKQRAELDARPLTKGQQASVEHDFEAMLRFIRHFDRHGAKAVAVFSSSGSGLWRSYVLAQPVRDRLIIDTHPHVRPLSRLLSQFRRCVAVLMARDHAAINVVHLGEIHRLAELEGLVPSEARARGLSGLEERQLERRAGDRLQQFVKSVVERTAEILRSEPSALLVASGSVDALAAFDAVAPHPIRDRVIARLPLGPEAPPAEILARLSDAVRLYEQDKGIQVAKSAIKEAEAGGLAVTGIEKTLAAFGRGQVAALTLARGMARPGLACGSCSNLAVEGRICPACGGAFLPVPDLVEELVHRAIGHSVAVVEIEGEKELDEVGGIAALLRYRGEETRDGRAPAAHGVFVG